MRAIALLALIWSSVAPAQGVSEVQASRETEINDLRLLEPTSGINVGYVENDAIPGGGKYLCGGMSASDARAAAAIAAGALAKVPAAALARIQLKYIILCGRALARGQPIGGIPVPPLNLLMLDMGGGASHASHGEHIVLHELYHLIEYRFGTFDDAEWQRRFGTGYANSYAGRLKESPIGSGKRGFLTSYSETFAHEERAELFAFLLLDSREVTAHIDASRDEALKAKAQYLIDKCNRLLGLALTLPTH